MKNSLASVLLIVLLVAGLGVGYFGGTSNAPSVTTTFTSTAVSTTTQTQTSPTTTTQTLTKTLTTTAVPNIVDLDIIPDWGGAGYDAFVIPTSINGSLPKPAAAGGKPGPNNSNITVAAGVPITFVITNLDTMNFTFSGKVTVPFTVYNDTASGYATLYYGTGQSVKLIASHTFTITALNINIPTPPDTVVTFTYTFAKPGIYQFFCQTPCGPGMAAPGYMIGYIIVR